ncbi:AMP-binding protein [Rhizorhabdus dicambivorans]|uniref:AMP-dependent synthetase n=1 Tax=Rhizorhabdus dicambivorans TaxID=1850238 RepID=A0A2A4FVH0_9SPHN|nr:AMP-binding protein [Rhizorhabdus dicambivorans]ATE63648.1 AMP-dependent synthetase [Rhizorhabdus dicambivorans]PCE42776.1 AMP-dependent synthetase [Rhizorhabdus dicambivorans]
MDISGIAIEDRNLVRVMETVLRERPSQTAIRDPDRALSYEGLWDEGLRIAGGLTGLGVGRQQPLVLMLDNHIDNVALWMAIGLSARIEVSVNTAYRGQMLAYIIADSHAEVAVVEGRYLARLIEIAEEIPSLHTVVVRQRAEAEGDSIERAARLWTLHDFAELAAANAASPEPVAPWELFSFSYTSGTTGRSKGVLCPHAHAFGQATSDGLGTTLAGETRFVVLPQFHAAGRWGGVYNALIHRGTAYVAHGFSASRYWEQAKEAGARTSQLVGTMAEFLQLQPERAADRDHDLREICILPLPRAFAAWRERFGVKLLTAYGSTESGAIIANTDARSNTVGRPRDGYDIRIFDENDIELPPGEVGEAVVRPSHPWTTSIGYLGRDEETAALWRNGWLHTGDALYRDEDGNFFFVDRLDDAIRRRGENISSVEVELHVCTHPMVAECAAVAVPSEFAEDEIKIAVTVKPGHSLSERALVDYLAGIMPRFMVPRFVQFVDELPKTATSKIRKTEIRKAGVAGCWDAMTEDYAAAAATDTPAAQHGKEPA